MPPFYIKDKDAISTICLLPLVLRVKAPGRMAVGILPDANDLSGSAMGRLAGIGLQTRHLDLPRAP